jgi:hypothetical protein
MKFTLPGLLAVLCFGPLLAFSQDSTSTVNKILNFPNRLFTKIHKNTIDLDQQVRKQALKYLEKLARKEKKLEQEVYAKDSVAGKSLFTGTQQQYQQLEATLNAPANPNIANPLRQYIPALDSMQTAMRFMNSSASTVPGFPSDKLQQIGQLNMEMRQLQARLQSANDIQQFVGQREQQLKNQLLQLGFAKEYAYFNQQSYYYQQQLIEYRNMLSDPKKLEEKMLATLSTLPAFQTFMAKHSYLSQLFSMPANYGTPASANGLQTKAMVGKMMGERMGSTSTSSGSGNSSNPQQVMQGAMQTAQSNLTKLQNQVSQLGNGSGSSGSIVMPEFSPNNQKTKTFLKRLELGYNLQTQKSNILLPTTTAFGLSLGYKLDDKKIVGVGASYNVGWGNGINHFAISSQGVGLRSFADLKFKGSIWITGGLEYDYLQQFQALRELYNLDVWQKSALLGLSKKYQLTKNKGGNLQVLYDFLYRDHVPTSPPILFRMGFSL